MIAKENGEAMGCIKGHKKQKKHSAHQSQDHLSTGIHLNLWIYTTGESPAGGNTLLRVLVPEEVHKQQHPEST